MKTELRKIRQLTCLILVVTSIFVAVPSVSTVLAATTLFTLNPASGTVGTSVVLEGNLTTANGVFDIRFDERLVANGTAQGNIVTTEFIVPDAARGDHTVKITDVAAAEDSNTTFTVQSAYSIGVLEKKTVQESDGVPISVNVTGGGAGETVVANVSVQAPTTLHFEKMSEVAVSDFGNGTSTVNFPADFSSDANTSFVGNYLMFLNTTLANSTFSVGLTNSSVYHRNQVVNVKAVYQPDENVTLTITGQDINFVVNTTDPSGLINYNWTVPADTAIGSYNVRVVSPTRSRQKSPSDNQDFTVPGFAINFTVKNLAGDSVPSVTVKAYEEGVTTPAATATSASSGLAALTLEGGNFSCKADFEGETVGEQIIAVNDTMSQDLVCNLTNLRIRVVSIFNGDETDIPEAGVFLTPENSTFSTDINGTVVVHSLLPNASYGLNLTRYGSSFNVTTVSNLFENGLLVGWFDLKFLCPTLSLYVAVTKADGNAFGNAFVKAQESLGAPLYEGNTNADGIIVFNSVFGRYRVDVFDSNGLFLNETTVDLFGDQNVTVPCGLYGLTVAVKVVDFFGQGIANANVTLLGGGQPAKSAPTQGDGTATFSDIVGGNLQVAVYMGDSSQPVAAQGFAVENSTTLQLRMDNYVVFAGMLVEASVLTTIIIIAVAAVVVLVVELYRRTRFKAEKSETNSSNKES